MSIKFNLFIGLECHVKLNFKKKLFSIFKYNSINNKYNENISYYDLSLPGILPINNYYNFNKLIIFGLFIKSIIFNISWFFRKSYFYPDVSKNYQITQYKQSIFRNGYILIYNNYVFFSYYKVVNILQCHVEEDTGKIIYDKNNSFIDYNRSGLVLLEVVSDCDLNSFYETILYILNLQNIFNIFNLSDCNMQDGNFRFDINISIKFVNLKFNSFKVELKNINSFNTLYYLIIDELKRQIFIYVNGDLDSSHTRGYDEVLKSSFLIRKKEKFLDYKYFKDPDVIYFIFKKNITNFLVFKSIKFLNLYNNIFFIKKFLNYNFNKIKNYKLNLNLYILLGFYFDNYFFILNCIFNINFFKIFKIKNLLYSFEQICILIKFLYFKFILYINFKKIINFISKYNINLNLYLYKILFYNKLNFNFIKKFLLIRLNKILLKNLFLIHNYIFNKKLINYFISLLNNKNFNVNLNFVKNLIFIKIII